MKHLIKSLLMVATLLALPLTFTSCEDILGHWEKPVANVTPSATITLVPTATTGDIIPGSTTYLVTVATADGGTVMYKVTDVNTKPSSTEGFSIEVPTAAGFDPGTYYVWYYAKGDATHNDGEISATAVKVKVQYSLSTPLTLEVLEAGTIVVTDPKSNMQYSLDGGNTKTQMTVTTTIPTSGELAAGTKVTFYGNGTSITCYNGTKIKGGTAKVKVYGNIMSLLNETGFATLTDPITLPAANTFNCLFHNNIYLTDASGLLLPATTLTKECYQMMFNLCSALTKAPELPATTLADKCYFSMFASCTSLTTTPKLPATTLAIGCYEGMFRDCTNLTTAPELPATTLTEKCYMNMFARCTNLTTAPELPAEKLANECYKEMFKGCTNLTIAPELKGTTLANECCVSMFQGCSSLTDAPALPATLLVPSCYKEMFNGCTNLKSVTCLATDINAPYCTTDWLSGVAATGTFTKAATMTNWTTGPSGIPSGWTVAP